MPREIERGDKAHQLVLHRQVRLPRSGHIRKDGRRGASGGWGDEKVHLFKHSGQCRHHLGAHLLGPRSDEAINTIALGMRAGLTATDLDEMLRAYPPMAADSWYMT